MIIADTGRSLPLSRKKEARVASLTVRAPQRPADVETSS